MSFSLPSHLRGETTDRMVEHMPDGLYFATAAINVSPLPFDTTLSG